LLFPCAAKTLFPASSAQGYAKIGRDIDQNYIIQIHISDLAKIEILPNPNQSYVFWMETNKGKIKT